MKLEHVLYRYGGEEAIRLSGESMPHHVLKAYKELIKIRQEGVNSALTALDIKEECKQLDKDTVINVSKECFNFLQQLINRHSWIIGSKSLFGGIFRQWE